MLPILRLLPIGGVALAILILVLALIPPDRLRSAISPTIIMEARGPLINRTEHPEWHQLVIQAALNRADELGHLDNAASTAIEHSPATGKLISASAAGAPIALSTGADQKTAAACDNKMPEKSAAIDDKPQMVASVPDDQIGARDKTLEVGLPTVLPKERQPLVVLPQTRPPAQKLAAHSRPRHKHPAKPQPQTAADNPAEFLDALFGGRLNQQQQNDNTQANGQIGNGEAQARPNTGQKKTTPATNGSTNDTFPVGGPSSLNSTAMD